MIDDGLLDAALSHRSVSFDAEVSDLVRLADLAGSLPFPGPDGAARIRMTARFDDYITGRSRPGFAAWVLGWLGAGPRPRSAMQRLAAGGMILLASASGASAITGQTPAGIAASVGSFTENLIHNLAPRSDTNLPVTAATDTPSPTPTLTPAPTSTPTPPPSATPTATATPASPGTGEDSGSSGEPQTGGQEGASTLPPPSPTVASPRTGTYAAGNAGAVTLSYGDSSLSVLSVQANHGWQFTIKQASGQRVEVVFSNNERRLTFSATLGSGQPSIQLRTTLPAPDNTRLPLPAVTRIPGATPPNHQGESEGDSSSIDAPAGVVSP